MSEITDKIRSKAHWEVAVRPEPYREGRLAYETLEELLEKITVRLRGWPVPFIDYREPFIRDADWIGQDVDAEIVDHFEAWRFFTSGQFTQLRSVSADWRTGPGATAVPAGYSGAIEIWEILFYVTEIFEFAKQLAFKSSGWDRISIDLQLHGMRDRALVTGDPRRVPFITPPRATMPTLRQAVSVSREELASKDRECAAAMSREFFLRFGWKPSLEQLQSLQAELLNG
jgi:hypothetical protein